MQLIYDIVKKLKKQEIRHIRHLIKHASFEYEKMGKLFELVTRYDERDESFYSQKLYGKEPDNTFRVTKSRLKRMLENVVLNDKSLTGYSAESTNARLQAKKKLLQGEILLGRGAYDASKNLLLQVVAAARKYEFHHEQFLAELLLYRNLSVRTSVREFEKNTEELLLLNARYAQINEAIILHYSISNLLANLTVEDEGLVAVREKVDRMKGITESTGHPLVKNLYYQSEITYLQVSGKYPQALDFCKRYLELVNQDPSQYSLQRVAAANVHLAQVSLRIHMIDDAEKYANAALDIFSPEEINYLKVLELSFRIAFYAADFPKALTHIDTALGHPQFEASRMLAAKWHYFHACVLFKMGKFREAYIKLNDTSPLLTDKYGMNLYIRMLEIMIMFELDNFDLMETKILNMRQFVKRTQRTQEAHRPISLVKILMKWHKNHYDFQKTLAGTKSQLAELHALQALQAPNNPDQELIQLETWMFEHTNT
jgi:hypothetical protein